MSHEGAASIRCSVVSFTLWHPPATIYGFPDKTVLYLRRVRTLHLAKAFGSNWDSFARMLFMPKIGNKHTQRLSTNVKLGQGVVPRKRLHNLSRTLVSQVVFRYPACNANPYINRARRVYGYPVDSSQCCPQRWCRGGILLWPAFIVDHDTEIQRDNSTILPQRYEECLGSLAPDVVLS